MKRIICSIAAAMVILASLPVTGWAAQLLVPVGQIIGLQLHDDTVTVAAFDETFGTGAREAGLAIGDRILRIEGQSIRSAEDIPELLEQDQVSVTVFRDGKELSLSLPVQHDGDTPKLGIYLRQGIAGIGTVTWYDPDTGSFGTLGHGVSDSKGTLLQMIHGDAYPARILSVKKGKCGDPGQLRGSADAEVTLGQLLKNTPQGVFGITSVGWAGEGIPVAAYEDVHTGPAVIRSTVCEDGPREYSVEILKIYPSDRSNGRNFLIHVTDPVLLDATGGIVQGMSGSPIIQDGKLVGAVTHVLVNDPTRGYGIFIKNMLEAAS